MKNLIKNRWLPFKEASKKVLQDAQNYNLQNRKDWYEYCKCGNKPVEIPASPNVVYKNRGWISWGRWLGTNNQKHGRKWYVNDGYFSKWSSNMAYVLGFWWADGWVHKSEKSNFVLGFSQHKKERYLLNNILEKMEATYPIYGRRDSDVLHFIIASKQMYQDIVRIVGSQSKSLNGKFPKVPRKYLPDFIRGYFDGDGSIFVIKGRKNHLSSITCGNKIFIEQMRNELEKNIKGLKLAVYSQDKLKSKSYMLRFYASNTVKLGRFMYKNITKDSLKMERKYELFKRAEGLLNGI